MLLRGRKERVGGFFELLTTDAKPTPDSLLFILGKVKEGTVVHFGVTWFCAAYTARA